MKSTGCDAKFELGFACGRFLIAFLSCNRVILFAVVVGAVLGVWADHNKNLPKTEQLGFPERHVSRILSWEGVDNVRDLGGLATKDGMTVRRHMVFRSQAFNCNAVSRWLTATRLERKARHNAELFIEYGQRNAREILLRIGTNDFTESCRAIAMELADGTNHWKKGELRGTPESRRRILEETGLRTEIDLRNKTETWGMDGSPLGPTVAWHNIPGVSIGELATPAGKEWFSKCFRIFLDEKNYPIDFHCIAGADRTGALALMLEALLGVSEDDIVMDYALTSASMSGIRLASDCRELISKLDGCPGATLKERVEAYALDCGFSSADIAKFRNIMLTDSQ